MIEVDVQTWASTATVLMALLATFGVLSRRIERLEDRLDSRIDGVQATLGKRSDDVQATLSDRINQVDGRIDRLTAHMDEGFGRVETRLTTLEQRSYDLAARLPAASRAAE